MKRSIHKDVESGGLGRVETFLTHRFWRSQVQVTQIGQSPYRRHMKPSCFEVPIGISAKENRLQSLCELTEFSQTRGQQTTLKSFRKGKYQTLTS